MKKLYRLYSILIIILFSGYSNADTRSLDPPTCWIGDVEATVLPCNEAGNFFVELDFEYENVSDNFKVQGNGTVYGIFPYTELPVTIGPLAGDGVTAYEFIVRDMGNPDCSNWTGIDPVDCNGGGGGECSIWDLYVEENPCNDEGMFTVYLDFEYENVSGDGFKLFVNDELLGMHPYTDLPLMEAGPFEGDGETVYHFFVRDIAHAECSDAVDFGPIDCEGGGGGECDLSDMEVEVLPCNDDGYFMVEVDFEYGNTSEGFLLWVNNTIWDDFSYDDLPVTVGPLEGDGETTWYFAAADMGHDDCATNTAIDPVDCGGGGGGDCSIDDVEATVLPCNESGDFFVLLDFEYEDVGDLGFSLVGNGNDYGDFEYEELPIEIGPLEGDGVTVYEFEARDNVFEDCFDWTEIDPVDCSSAPMLNNLTTEVMSCDDDLFQLQVDFQVEGNVSGDFTISGNGTDYGTFSYSQLPVVLGPLGADGETSYYFIVRDQGQVPFGNWNRLTPFTCADMGLGEATGPEKYNVFYNRASHSIVVECDQAPAAASARIVDMQGRQVATGQLHGSETHIPLPEAFSGAAVWIIVSGKDQYRGKLIIR